MKDLSKWNHLFCRNATPVNKLENLCEVKVSVKRDDLNHNVVQGNKLRKLKYNINYAIKNDKSYIATFGGAWSNHILATAEAASLCGLKSIGFIRGDELYGQPHLWSRTLHQANECGMDFVFLSRIEYRLKQQSKLVQIRIQEIQKEVHLVPEGGSNSLALLGVSEIITELQQQIKMPSHVITACGTGGTMAGLIDGIAKAHCSTKVIGIPVLKNSSFLYNDIKNLVSYTNQQNWKLYDSYHFGGYAKSNQELRQFGNDFVSKTGIDLDKIYTAKSFYAAYDLIKKGEIPAKSHLLILHTGGLQGGSIIETI